MKYSVIVPYFRTPEITRICLYSIFKLSRGEPEVIVVDNAPASTESRMLLEFPKARVLKNATEIRGSDANFEALDLGLEQASHDLVALIHSDTIFLKEGWDLKCFSHLEKHRLAALGTFEREANPFRPVKRKIRDGWRHLRHAKRPSAATREKLMVHFLLTRRSTLRQTGFSFRRDRDIAVSHFAGTGRPVEVLSLIHMSRLIWHTSNITSLLTGQMNDPALAAIYREKRARFIRDPRIRELFGPVLPAK